MVLDCTDYEEGLVVLGMVCSSYQSPASLTMKQQSCVNRGYARLNKLSATIWEMRSRPFPEKDA